MTVAYRGGSNLYINLTNRCSCACTFCIRQKCDAVGLADTLWLDHDPSAEEAIEAIAKFEPESYDEIVFCGFGEPTEALDVLLEVASEIKSRWDKPTRLDTNGQGSLIAGRDIVPDLVKVIDTVSISLNSCDSKSYQEITRSEFGEQAYAAMLDFAKEAVSSGMNVIMTTVGTTITHEQEQECAKICKEIGARYRIRVYSD